MQVVTFDSSEARSDPRSNVFLMAVLYSGAGSTPVRVRNLSVGGALLEGARLPVEGAAAELRRGSLNAAGEVAWSQGGFCGLQFAGAVEVDEWIRRVGPEHQQRIDAAIASHRSGTIADAHLAVLNRPKVQATLDATSIDLLKIAERIASMPDCTIELAEEILKIEAAAQTLRSVAKFARG